MVIREKGSGVGDGTNCGLLLHRLLTFSPFPISRLCAANTIPLLFRNGMFFMVYENQSNLLGSWPVASIASDQASRKVARCSRPELKFELICEVGSRTLTIKTSMLRRHTRGAEDPTLYNDAPPRGYPADYPIRFLGMVQFRPIWPYGSPENPHPRRCGDSPSPRRGRGGWGVRASSAEV